MNNNLQSIIGNLEKGDKLVLGNNEKFSNEIVLNHSLQCSVLGGINFVNLTFKNIDFTGSFFSKTIFENCRFSNVIFRKSEFWSCTFLECQIKESNLTRVEFNSNTFKNCEFLNSNLRASNFMDFEFRETIFKNSHLDLILVEDVKVWKSDEWIQIKDFSSFESHVMGITPAPAYEFSSVDEGQNPGFTPLNSFESDVMGITPLDSSSSDYQI